jgi:hypothetical protein
MCSSFEGDFNFDFGMIQHSTVKFVSFNYMFSI